MTTTEQNRPTSTDRTLPVPWEMCDMCGRVPALPAPGTLGTLCPDCARLQALTEAADQSLIDSVGPHLGAWVAHWQRAGVSLRELMGVIENAADYHTRSDLAEPRRFATLRALGMKYAPPAVTPALPAHVTLDVAALPVIEGHMIYADTYPGNGKPYRLNVFTVRLPNGERDEGRIIHPGPDALLMLNATPQGDAVLYLTGMHGQLFPADYPDVLRCSHALRVPPQFLPAVREALGYWDATDN
ncbi:hypothetical protein [Deinococcus apachensis]|uniref:hypothetical protein n=1 Tax=Deinococcus apachensis TaxID=309886 RepID=UPI00039B2F15|nr:hypothetical protein [Deinococcus apachensis]